MTTVTEIVPVGRRRRSPLRALVTTEARLFLRDPLGTFFGVFFPPVLLLVLGSAIPYFREPNEEFGGASVLDVFTPVAIAMAIATIALLTLTGVLSSYREKGVLRRLATTPVGARRMIVATAGVQGAGLVLSIGLTIVVASLVLDIAPPASWTGASTAVVLGTASMSALGALIAALAPNARAASGIGTAVYFPMLFLAGTWTPGPLMPDVIQRVADFFPLGAASAALQDAWSGSFPELLHLAVMIVWAAACGFGASRLFRWE